MSSDGDQLARIEISLSTIRAAISLGNDPEQVIHSIVPEDIRDAVYQSWQEQEQNFVTFKRVVHLYDSTAGPRAWFNTHDPARGYHWQRLRYYLLTNKGYSRPIVESLDDASDTILSNLEDPSPNTVEKFRIQGLVLGRVQSGKTANYTALIAKAVDAGYKLVIVLAGIHNQLRWQTQQRLTEELGLSETPAGVGIPEQGQRWITITEPKYDGDFYPGSIQASYLGDTTCIAVVKKNATVLRRLLDWLQERPSPSHLPVLIIDDEADQASINTGDNRDEPLRELVDLADEDIGEATDINEEIQPSTINGLIRSLVSEFDQVCYVAYTATPFANVLIEPIRSDYEAGPDLYPHNFIISLPTSDQYVGAKQLFGHRSSSIGTQSGLDVVSVVPELDSSYLNPNNPNEQVRMTPSLEKALSDFVLASVAKAYRDQQANRRSPSTMLIHTTHRIFAQIQLGTVVSEEMSKMRNGWRYDSEEEETKYHLKDRWYNEFSKRNKSTSTISFTDITPHIDNFFRHRIPVCVFNSATDDQLDYDKNPHQRVIVIGGNRLSRGITLEGLIVSYFTRRGRYYDTIMQAARWFGYRLEYADLTRLWTTAEMYQYFRHLAEVEEDLRDQIEMYERMGKSPRDLSPLILAHPDLEVTAPQRMGAGQQHHTNFSGQFIQSVRLYLDNTKILNRNLDLTRNLIETLRLPNFDGYLPRVMRHTWQEIEWETIASYIGSFDVPGESTNFRPNLLENYIRRQANENNELIRWTVSVIERSRQDTSLGTIDIGSANGEVNAIGRSRLKIDSNSVGVLANPVPPRWRSEGYAGDESIGLTSEQINNAEDEYQNDQLSSFRLALRQQRDPAEGLLCIYPISQYSKAKSKNRSDLFNNPNEGVPVIGLAVLFPPSEKSSNWNWVGGPLATRSTQ